jgi:hypothetical protein
MKGILLRWLARYDAGARSGDSHRRTARCAPVRHDEDEKRPEKGDDLTGTGGSRRQ